MPVTELPLNITAPDTVIESSFNGTLNLRFIVPLGVQFPFTDCGSYVIDETVNASGAVGSTLGVLLIVGYSCNVKHTSSMKSVVCPLTRAVHATSIFL